MFGYVEGRFGAHAELLTVPADGFLARIPDGVPDDVAAAATEGAHYAVAVLRRARITAGEDVLVHGATGAIGSAAVQLLRVLGAHVTAVCDGPHTELVRGLGAERVIEGTIDDALAEIDDALAEIDDVLAERTATTSSSTRWGRAPSVAAGRCC
ncbi:hypothetical protein A7K94_0210325, partial [Modestobacter sp. VKM Ac-2676]